MSVYRAIGPLVKMTPASVMRRFKANGADLTCFCSVLFCMSGFHRASAKILWLRLCRITNESTETENCY